MLAKALGDLKKEARRNGLPDADVDATQRCCLRESLLFRRQAGGRNLSCAVGAYRVRKRQGSSPDVMAFA